MQKILNILLFSPHICIHLPLPNQLLMSPSLHNLPTTQHKYLVSISHCGESVSNYYAGSVFANFKKRFLNDFLCCRVKSTGSFIKKKKFR